MSKDNITDYGKSIRSKLLNIAKKEDVFRSQGTLILHSDKIYQ